MSNYAKITNVLPDPNDPGDFYFPVDFTVTVPTSIDLRPENPPIENQR